MIPRTTLKYFYRAIFRHGQEVKKARKIGVTAYCDTVGNQSQDAALHDPSQKPQLSWPMGLRFPPYNMHLAAIAHGWPFFRNPASTLRS